MPSQSDRAYQVRVRAIESEGVPITYMVFLSDHPNLKTGDVGGNYDEITIPKALKTGLNKTNQGIFRRFRIKAADLSKPPTVKDQVKFDGALHIITDWMSDQSEKIYDLVTRRV